MKITVRKPTPLELHLAECEYVMRSFTERQGIEPTFQPYFKRRVRLTSDFQALGLGNERTHDMGGNAHSTEVTVETEDATTTVIAPDEATTEAQEPAEASTDDSGSESTDSV